MERARNIYTVIIGSELLNGRRADAHFEFANQLIIDSGHTHKGSFVIEDKPELIRAVFELIKSDKDSVLFSFGGIWATPDDITRQISAEVFSDGVLSVHEEGRQILEDRFGDDAYPHRINLVTIPKCSKLLENVVNRVPGYYLEERFFFMPGFPQMSHPMMEWAMRHVIRAISPQIHASVCVEASENDLIPLMEQIPQEFNLSSLPKMEGERRTVVLSVSNRNKNQVDVWYDFILTWLEARKLNYKKGEIC
jgi:molybdopterin-biosynthesis enzyme MoeA-like protein